MHPHADGAESFCEDKKTELGSTDLYHNKQLTRNKLQFIWQQAANAFTLVEETH